MSQYRIIEVGDLHKSYQKGQSGLAFEVKTSDGDTEQWFFCEATHGPHWRLYATEVHTDFEGVLDHE